MAGFPVDPSRVTPAWLSGVLGADVRECRLEQIGIGVGLLGRLYRAHLNGRPGRADIGGREIPDARHSGQVSHLRGS